jgi:hypothetical protein
MLQSKFGKLAAVLVAVWFLFALSASALGVFKNETDRPALPLIVAAVTPIIVFSIWYATSQGFRRFVLGLNPRTLTYLQAWRIAGLMFVALYMLDILPGVFALPAGWGDFAVGVTAPVVAAKFAQPQYRRGFILWQIFGMADLVVAMTSGVLSGNFDPQATSMVAMTVLPLSLVPSFIVPLLMIVHIISIAQARRWSAQQTLPAQARRQPPRHNSCFPADIYSLEIIPAKTMGKGDNHE